MEKYGQESLKQSEHLGYPKRENPKRDQVSGRKKKKLRKSAPFHPKKINGRPLVSSISCRLLLLYDYRYDALLASNDSWYELCSRGMFHSGDSDSTGVIAAACYGAMHGFKGVPQGNYKVGPPPPI